MKMCFNMLKCLIILISLSATSGVENVIKQLCQQDALYSCLCLYIENQNKNFLSVSVDCHAKNLSTIDEDVRIPQFTEKFDLSVNYLTEVPHNTIFTSSLETLLLNKNHIKKIDISAFDRLSNLKTLDLSENQLEDIEQGVFHGIFKLKSLNLAGNKLKFFKPNTFFYLPLLNSINLSHNTLGTFFENVTDIFTIAGLSLNPKLESLELNNISATRFVPDFFNSAYNLRRIVLSHNDFDTMPKIPFTIEYLDISSTQISSIGPKDFINLPAITHYIANNLTRLTEIQNHTFYVLKNLQYLSFENCKDLQSFNPYAFGMGMLLENDTEYEFTLKHISLMGSGLKTLDKRLSPYFSRLSSLDIRGNPWRCDCHLEWLSKLQINQNDKEFIRCYYPRAVRFHKLFLLKSNEFVCTSNYDIARWAILNCIIFFCILMSFFALWLVFIWPKSKMNKVGVEPYYSPITIRPNNAEDNY